MTTNRTIVFVWGGATGVGGTETRMMEAAAELRLRGIRVVMIAVGGRPDSAFAGMLNANSDAVRWPTSIVAVRRELKSAGAPVIAFGFRASFMVRLALLGTTGPSLFDARNGLEFGRSRWLWELDRWSQSRVRRYIVNSFAVRDSLVKHGIHDDRIRVIESALGSAWLEPPKSRRSSRKVLMVGNSRPEKDHQSGIEAALMVPGELHLHVYTDDASQLRRLVRTTDWGGDKTITLVEGVRVTPEIMASAAVLLHPSRSESLPRVVLEAMAVGVIPVVTNTGDSARIVDGYGLVVAVGDVAAMADAVAKGLGQAERERVAGSRRPARGVAQYCDEMLQVLA